MHSLAFYLFSFFIILSGIMVISARNPVHSVLFLILAFFSTAGIFILLGAEFLAMILVVVYVGAVAVLFMFVVMMLDINFVEMRQGFLKYLPIGGFIGAILLIELLVIVSDKTLFTTSLAPNLKHSSDLNLIPNTHALGEILYTDYIFLFQTAGLILLLSMIGAIVLTHRKREGVKRQKIRDQISIEPNKSVKLKKVESGRGI